MHVAAGEQGDGRPGEASDLIRTHEERELFRRRYDRYPRSVLSETHHSLAPPSPRMLTEVLKKAHSRLQRSDGPAWRAVVVRVEEGDGMTWSAAAADRLIGEVSPLPCRKLVAEPRADGFPQLVELLPKRRLVDLAQEKGAVESLLALRRRSVVLAAIAVLALGAVIAALQGLSAAGGFNFFVPLLGAGGAALLLLSEEVSARLRHSARRADEAKLLVALREAAEQRPRAWSALVEALSAELADARRDRAVIVDGFDRLDRLTRETLCHYLVHRARPSHSHELWVVFESADIATVSKEVSNSRGRPGRSHLVRLEVLRQKTLDEPARIALASEIGHPERADRRLVKSIVGRESAASAVFAALFDGQSAAQSQDARPCSPLEVAYLLAVQHMTGAWGFRDWDLIGELSSEGSSASSQVLRLLLSSGTPGRGEVGEAVERLKHELKRALDPERAVVGQVELVTEAAEVLVERRGQYGLPAEDLVHLYWALHWHSKLRGAAEVDAYRLRKLARHLTRAVTPGALGDRASDEIRERFRDALTWTARSLLAASLPEHVRALLLRAEREAGPGEDHSGLRSVCWQAYAVLGDEDMLAIILRLHSGSSGSAPAPTEPEWLFVESLRSIDAAPAVRRELSERLLSLDRDIRSYARVRGIWMALTLDPVVDGTWSRFTSVTTSAASQAATLIQEGLRSLEDPNRPRSPVAALTVSLGVWCYALGFLQGGRSIEEANDLLEDVRLHAAQLHDDLDGRRREGRGEDYVLRAFAQELETAAGAAALVISGAVSAVESSPEERTRLEDHVCDAHGGASLDIDGQFSALERQMALQSLAWRMLGSGGEGPLGFGQLVAFMTLRRTHLSTMSPRQEGLVEVASGLAEQLEEPGAIGLMAHAIAIRSAPSEEITAHFWARAAGRASGFGDGLAAEICLVALADCHAFGSVDKRPLAKRLLGGDDRSPDASDLAERLAELGDDDRCDMALWLLNAAGGASEAVAGALVAQVKEMREQAEGDAAKDDMLEAIELFELTRALREDRPVAMAETLMRWEPRRESFHYPWLLYLLVKHPAATPAAVDAAVTYLEERPEVPSTWAPVLLAQTLARRAGSNALLAKDPGDVGLAYLDRVHPSFEQRLSIEDNISILHQFLRRPMGDRERNLAGLEKWEAARLERDAIEKLPELVEAGRFFLVFWHYYETLAFYGLPVEPKADHDELAADDGAVEVFVEGWERGEPAPEPLVANRSGTALSADFLRYGRALFGKAAENSDLEEAREVFNDTAREALPSLFDQLRGLPSLPDRIRTLLTDHQAQLLRRAVPSQP